MYSVCPGLPGVGGRVAADGCNWGFQRTGLRVRGVRDRWSSVFDGRCQRLRVPARSEDHEPCHCIDDHRGQHGACDSQRRPNQLAINFPRLRGVDSRDLLITNLDAVDGTPVIDVAPYFEQLEPRGAVRQPPWPGDMLDPCCRADASERPTGGEAP
ncbi:hypothetical protein HPT28_09105 [Streptomyces sp. JJ38]|nr:hypothetical protein [Streptomyces sp. JJ38]